jgi:nucleotide-binding universal stress UspA family protein
MQKLINHILAPIGPGKRSALVAERAVRMANHFQSSLHLLYAGNIALVPFLSTPGENEPGNTNNKLSVLEERFGSLLEPGLPFRVSMCRGDIERKIGEYAIRNFIDVTVIGSSGSSLPGSLFGSLSINRLARRTKSAVLTVNESLSLENVQNIVLPVEAHLPMRKVMIASYVARKFNAKIHLIGLSKRNPLTSVNDALYLYKTFQLLRDNTNLAVEYHILPGENIADKTLEYARSINADLIVVNPGKELLLSGFVNKIFARFIFNESAIPVMTINAAD